MGKSEPYEGVEQGPFRPPSEANSLLIRVTRNCPWNQCTFCPLYKGEKFSIRPVSHVLRDIDKVEDYVLRMQDIIHERGRVMHSDFERFYEEDDHDRRAMHAAWNFINGGMKSIFLQDGNSLIIKPDDLHRILKRLQEAFPDVDRVTSYARSKTAAKVSDDDLLRFCEAGLNRLHIGLESGSDAVLTKVRKGVDKKTQIKAGQKVKRAGMQLSEYWMPGLGGAELSRENALETADALNQINPDFIRLRTLALPSGAPITEQHKAGEFTKMGEVETVRELKLMIENLSGITSTIRSDHTLNLFYEVDGKLPEERDKLLAPLTKFLDLPPEEQMLYAIGRRTHRMSALADLDDPAKRKAAREMIMNLGATVDNYDEVIDRIMKQFI